MSWNRDSLGEVVALLAPHAALRLRRASAFTRCTVEEKLGEHLLLYLGSSVARGVRNADAAALTDDTALNLGMAITTGAVEAARASWSTAAHDVMLELVSAAKPVGRCTRHTEDAKTLFPMHDIAVALEMDDLLHRRSLFVCDVLSPYVPHVDTHTTPTALLLRDVLSQDVPHVDMPPTDPSFLVMYVAGSAPQLDDLFPSKLEPILTVRTTSSRVLTISLDEKDDELINEPVDDRTTLARALRLSVDVVQRTAVVTVPISRSGAFLSQGYFPVGLDSSETPAWLAMPVRIDFSDVRSLKDVTDFDFWTTWHHGLTLDFSRSAITALPHVPPQRQFTLVLPTTVDRLRLSSGFSDWNMCDVVDLTESPIREIVFGNDVFDCVTAARLILPANTLSIGHSAFGGLGVGSPAVDVLDLTRCDKLHLVGRKFAMGTSMQTAIFGPCPKLKSFGAHMMQYCHRLKCLSMNAMVALRHLPSGVCGQCRSLTDVRLPGSLRSIGDHAFDECRSLALLDLRDATSLTSIGSHFCCNATALCAVRLPPSLTAIGGHCFAGCKALTAVEGFEHTAIATLPAKAFKGCASLVTVRLPPTIFRVERCVFQNCPLIKRLDLTSCRFTLQLMPLALKSLRYATIVLPASVQGLDENPLASFQVLKRKMGAQSNIVITNLP